jgi:hypothetical protein
MRISFALLIFLSGHLAFGQGYYPITQETFGKNRIQLRKLDWRTINTNNFEFNYYRGGDAVAQKAAKIAEGEYRRITEILGYTPFTTMKIFLYNSASQLAQSNIGLTSPVTYDGGILNVSRSRIEIPYPGNDSLFRQQLIREISSLFVYDMLYGGSLKEVLQSSILLTVPEWFMSGIAAYIADDELTPEIIGEIQEVLARNENKKISHIAGKDAEIIGKSIWHYIAVRYGKDNISNILNLTRIIRAEQSSITSTLGISFSRFSSEWKAFYRNGGSVVTETKSNPVQNAPRITEAPAYLKEKTALKNLRTGEIDTEFYEFDEVNVLKSEETQQKILEENSSTFNRNRLKRAPEELKITPPRAYQNMLVAQDIKTQFLNDPIRRIGMHNSLTVNDLLENHVFNFDLFIAPVIKNHDIKASYTNYKSRVDWGFFFERRSILLEGLNEKQYYIFRPLKIAIPDISLSRRIYLHTIGANIHYPFSEKLRISFTPKMFFNNDIDYYHLDKRILNSSYAGLRTSLVYDNTTNSIAGTLNGTRAKITYEKNVGFADANQNFNRLNIDARHYQPIVRGIQLAGRLAYGSSNGNSPKYTFLGGMENTINRSVYSTPGQIPGDPGDLRDIVFYNYAGNLRGFDFAKLYGTSYLLTNLELRITLSSYFPKNTVNSSVLRNLQLVAFNDIGTAWNGNKGPWSRQNSLNTQEIGNGNPFYAVVTNFKNPFLSGYGGGIRTSLLGLTVKADYAFGRENKEFGPGRFYFSLGHDF